MGPVLVLQKWRRMEIDSTEIPQMHLVPLYLNTAMGVSFMLCVFHHFFQIRWGGGKQKKHVLAGKATKRGLPYFVPTCWNLEIMSNYYQKNQCVQRNIPNT